MAPRKTATTVDEPVPTTATTDEPVPTTATTDEPVPARNYQLKKSFMQKVQGDKEHPTWKAVLDALHQLGLRSIETDIVQIPTESNGQVAIVKARITLEDGSSFEAVGLADPSNVPNKMIAKHMLHMAETRSKGRAGRDAINVAEAILEEMASTDASSNFTPAVRNPTIEAIDAIWAGTDSERKLKVRQYIVDHLSEEFNDQVPTIASLADVKALPESYLQKALNT